MVICFDEFHVKKPEMIATLSEPVCPQGKTREPVSEA
jgi:hypothetical protein